MCGLQVLQEGLGPSVKKEVWWLVKPSAAMPVLVGLAAKGVAVRALIEKVVKGVGRSATLASQLVHEDVWSEATGVVEGEHMAHSKAEGSGGGVPGVDGQGLACLWVHVSLQGFPPERVVIAVEGVNDSILMDKGGVEAGMGCGSPLSRPAGESVFTGNSLTVRH